MKICLFGGTFDPPHIGHLLIAQTVCEAEGFDKVIFIPANKIKTIPIEVNKNVLAYIFEGSANFEYASKPQGVMVEKMINGQEVNIQDMTGNRTLINFDRGDEIKIKTSSDGVRFLLIGGTPIQEPVAWHGPIVMNTNEELMQAMKELNNGTFIKK